MVTYSGLDSIQGQPIPIQIMTRALTTGRLAHAYLFTGPAGIGKKTTAIALYRVLNCTGTVGQRTTITVCGTCPGCIRGKAGNQDDLTIFDPTPAGLTDRIGDLLETVRYAAHSGPARVVILPQIDTYHTAAVNRLLKTLEEPIPGTYFILTASTPTVLPTIRSRSSVVRFRAPSEQDAIVILAGCDVSSPLARQALAATGTPGQALAYLAAGGAKYTMAAAAFLAARTPIAITAALGMAGLSGAGSDQDLGPGQAADLLCKAANALCYTEMRRGAATGQPAILRAAVHNLGVIQTAVTALSRHMAPALALEYAGRQLQHAEPPPALAALDPVPAHVKTWIGIVFGPVVYREGVVV